MQAVNLKLLEFAVRLKRELQPLGHSSTHLRDFHLQQLAELLDLAGDMADADGRHMITDCTSSLAGQVDSLAFGGGVSRTAATRSRSCSAT